MRKPTIAAVLLAVGLVVAACGDDDPASSAAVEASPTTAPTTTATPWSATTKPERPADEKSDASALAFTEFAADTVLYVLATGNAPALSAISDLSSCASCRTWDDNYSDGRIEVLSVPSGPTTYTPTGEPSVTDGDFYKVALTMDIPKGEKVRKKSGQHVDNVRAGHDVPFTADLQWKDDQWVLMRYEMG